MYKPHRYQNVIDIKHEKPYLTWTAAAREAGFEVGNFTSSGKYTKDGKAIPKVKNPAARKRQAKQRALEMKFDKELLAEIERQEKLGNLKGEDYFADRQRRLDEYKKELKRLRKLGYAVDDGHMTTRKNNSPDARAPERSRVNQGKSNTLPQSDQDMLDAFLPLSDVDDLYHFMAPSKMPKVGIRERTRMLSGEISGEQAASLADRKFQLDQQQQPVSNTNKGMALIKHALSTDPPSTSERVPSSQPQQLSKGRALILHALGKKPLRTTTNELGGQNLPESDAQTEAYINDPYEYTPKGAKDLPHPSTSTYLPLKGV